MRLLYFAWVREKAGLADEEVTLPANVRDVAGLIAWLAARGGGPAAALADPARVRVAVNQELLRNRHHTPTKTAITANSTWRSSRCLQHFDPNTVDYRRPADRERLCPV